MLPAENGQNIALGVPINLISIGIVEIYVGHQHMIVPSLPADAKKSMLGLKARLTTPNLVNAG